MGGDHYSGWGLYRGCIVFMREDRGDTVLVDFEASDREEEIPVDMFEPMTDDEIVSLYLRPAH